MSDEKHSPGPWAWGKSEKTGATHLRDAKGRVVLTGDNRNILVQGNANAALIARAPDLLQALREIRDFSDASVIGCSAEEARNKIWFIAREALKGLP
jgi:hypothetical protein